MLAVARTLTTLTRLLDVLSLLEKDHRLQMFFTVDNENAAVLRSDLAPYLAGLGAHVVSWDEARGSRFDLILAASENDRIEQLDGPVLLLTHGLGFQKYYPGTTVIAGMDPARLVQDGRVIPARIALSHHEQRRHLAVSCPAAVERSVVVGDPCLDHLMAYRHHGQRYRRMLGATAKQVVLLASTWGPESLFGRMTGLPERLLGELPADEYVVALVLHPGVYAAHGSWQVRGWLAEAVESGMVVVPPHGEWRPALISASAVISDSGSLALYAAALDKPVLLTGPSSTVVAGSPIAALVSQAPQVDPNLPLRAQIEETIRRHAAGTYSDIVQRAADHEGHCAERLRPVLYELLNLPEPTDEAVFPKIPGFVPDESTVGAFVVGVTETADGLVLSRYPALSAGEPKLDYRHIAARLEHANLSQLDGATVIYLKDNAVATLKQWPTATIAATAEPDGGCRVWTSDGSAFRLSTTADLDPLLLASVVHIRREQGRQPLDVERIQVGNRVIDVHVSSLGQAP